jgi:hypothetical protein
MLTDLNFKAGICGKAGALAGRRKRADYFSLRQAETLVLEASEPNTSHSMSTGPRLIASAT